MMKFLAYGVVWQAEHALPFTPIETDRRADVLVRFEPDRPERINCDRFTRTLTHNTEGFCLRMEAPDAHWADFVWAARDKTLTIVTSRPVAECWPALVGVIPAILLREQQCTLLHGAVVALDGNAIAVLGDSGMGKSTLSARLIGRGAAVVSDDLILVNEGAHPLIERGYTKIGLLPDTAEALSIDETARSGVRSGDGKIQIIANAQAEPQTPLAAIIVLSKYDPALTVPKLERQSVLKSVPQLRANLYGSWISPLTPSDAGFCLRLAESTPLYTLSRPADITLLDAACALIERLVEPDVF